MTTLGQRRLPLEDGKRYDVETAAGTVWRNVRWHQEHYAFMLNAKGGIPMGFVTRVSRSFADDWHDLGEIYVPRTAWCEYPSSIATHDAQVPR